MLVSEVRIESFSDRCELQAKVESEALNEPFLLKYQFPKEFKEFLDPGNGDFALAALLLPAMRTGEPLEICVPISTRLRRSIDQIQDIYRCWDPTLSRVTIKAPVYEGSSSLTRCPTQVGLFFSLGVDSFYTLLKNKTGRSNNGEVITYLIVVHGFDIYFGKWNTNLYPLVLTNAAKVAQELDAKILPVATNIRDLSDQFADWGVLYHGAAMASVALAVENLFSKVYIAASNSYARLHPWGTHPLLDPLWSTEKVSLVHDGCEATRLEKVYFIARFPIVLETLRVCFMNPNNEYNCGRCEKCLRTMICLYLAGALQQCKTLPKELDLDLVRKMPIKTHNDKTRYEELIQHLGSSERELAVRQALEECLHRSGL